MEENGRELERYKRTEMKSNRETEREIEGGVGQRERDRET